MSVAMLPGPVYNSIRFPFRTVYKLLVRFEVGGFDFFYACSAAAVGQFVGRLVPDHVEVPLAVAERIGVGFEGDLGARMYEAFDSVFRDGYQKAALVGADIPDLLHSAAEVLG